MYRRNMYTKKAENLIPAATGFPQSVSFFSCAAQIYQFFQILCRLERKNGLHFSTMAVRLKLIS